MKRVKFPFFHTKVLFLVALLAFSSMATAVAVPQRALRGSNSSNTLNADTVSLIERPDVTPSAQSNDEERGIPNFLRPVVSSYHTYLDFNEQSPTMIKEFFQILGWQLQQKNPDEVFGYLKLGEIKDGLLNHRNFFVWRNFVEATEPEDKVLNVMFDVLKRQFGGDPAVIDAAVIAPAVVDAPVIDPAVIDAAVIDAVIDALYGGVSAGTKMSIEEARFNVHIMGIEREKLFERLGLNKLTALELINSPLFEWWIILVSPWDRGSIFKHLIEQGYTRRKLIAAMISNLHLNTLSDNTAIHLLQYAVSGWTPAKIEDLESLTRPERLQAYKQVFENEDLQLSMDQEDLAKSSFLSAWLFYVFDHEHIGRSTDSTYKSVCQHLFDVLGAKDDKDKVAEALDDKDKVAKVLDEEAKKVLDEEAKKMLAEQKDKFAKLLGAVTEKSPLWIWVEKFKEACGVKDVAALIEKFPMPDSDLGEKEFAGKRGASKGEPKVRPEVLDFDER